MERTAGRWVSFCAIRRNFPVCQTTRCHIPAAFSPFCFHAHGYAHGCVVPRKNVSCRRKLCENNVKVHQMRYRSLVCACYSAHGKTNEKNRAKRRFSANFCIGLDVAGVPEVFCHFCHCIQASHRHTAGLFAGRPMCCAVVARCRTWCLPPRAGHFIPDAAISIGARATK